MGRLLSVLLSSDALVEPAATAITKLRNPNVFLCSPVSPHLEAPYSILTFRAAGEYPRKEIIDDIDKKLLLTIRQQCHKQNISLPWKEIGETMGAKISKSAIIQHLEKLRIRMVAQGLPFPPLMRGRGTKIPNGPRLPPRATAVSSSSTARGKSSEKYGKPAGMIETYRGDSPAGKDAETLPPPYALKQDGSEPIASQDVAREAATMWPAWSRPLTGSLEPLPPFNYIIHQSQRERAQANRIARNREVAEVARKETPVNQPLKRALSQAGASFQATNTTKSTSPGYKSTEVIDLISDGKEGAGGKRRRFEVGSTPSNPSSSGTRPPPGHDQELQREQNQLLMRIARHEAAATQYLSKQNEQLQGVPMLRLQDRQNIDQLQTLTIQNKAKNHKISQEVDHLQGTNMPEQAKTQALSQQIEHLKEMIKHLIELVEQLRRSNAQDHSAKLTVIKNVAVSNANIEAAVDTREAEMRVGLSNMWGTPEQMKAQAMQLLDYSNTTSWLVSRLVVGALLEHQEFLTDEEHKVVELQYDNAEPNPEVAAIMAEKLTFMLDGPDRSRSMTLDL